MPTSPPIKCDSYLGPVIAILLVFLLIVVPLSYYFGQKQDAEWLEQYSPAYVKGDVLKSKLGEKLIVANVVVRGPGNYWYDCWYFKNTECGRRRAWRYFKLYEIQGKWESKTVRSQ